MKVDYDFEFRGCQKMVLWEHHLPTTFGWRDQTSDHWIIHNFSKSKFYLFSSFALHASWILPNPLCALCITNMPTGLHISQRDCWGGRRLLSLLCIKVLIVDYKLLSRWSWRGETATNFSPIAPNSAAFTWSCSCAAGSCFTVRKFIRSFTYTGAAKASIHTVHLIN